MRFGLQRQAGLLFPQTRPLFIRLITAVPWVMVICITRERCTRRTHVVHFFSRNESERTVGLTDSSLGSGYTASFSRGREKRVQ